MACVCKICVRGKEFQEKLALIPEEHRKYFEEIYDQLNDVENSLDHANAIIDGSWPDADSIIMHTRFKKVRSMEAANDSLIV